MITSHEDDPTIPNEERLFRRIHVVHLVPDGEGGTIVSSGAFKDEEMPVNLESVMKAAGRPPESALENNPHDKLTSLTAGECRAQRQQVGRDPLPEEPAHGYVFGNKNRPKIGCALRDAAEWEVPPEAPAYDEIHALKLRLGLSE